MKRIISSIILVMMLFSVATTAFANDCYYYDTYGVHAYAQESFSYPTCTEPGYVVISCTVCGDSYREETGDAYGHSWYKAAESLQPVPSRDIFTTAVMSVTEKR